MWHLRVIAAGMLMQRKGLAGLGVRNLMHICQRKSLLLLVLVSYVYMRAHWLLLLVWPRNAAIKILLCIVHVIANVILPLFVINLLRFT